MPAEIKRIEIIIIGQVQGVLFRFYAKEQAERLGVNGWAKNEPDGSVKIVAEGDEKRLQEFAAWCYNGPVNAKVAKTKVEWQKATGQFKEFSIRY